MFFYLLIVQSLTLDICRQLTTYDQCIASKTEYCRWFHHQRYCRQSEDLMLGCDRNLSEKLCMRQISTPISSQVLCVFDTICHEITNPEQHFCSENLNKFGCLSITNKQQFCKWENKCVSLSSDEIAQINTIFPDLQLSMSVCPLITGYLIAHSNVVQQLSSTVDYALLAQENDLVTTEPTYDDGTLQNNYVNENGQFVWYGANQQQQFTLQSLKINDLSRAGCIGLDISNDQMFTKLFSLENIRVLEGVNHVYCQYINMNPYLIQISVFVNNECQIISKEEIQQRTDIICETLGRYSCQLSTQNCEVVQPIGVFEYQCKHNDSQQANVNCDPNSGLATAQQCKQSARQCFLDFDGQNGFCSNACFNLQQSDCESLSNCLWITEDLDSSFYKCSPVGGCTQQGLSQVYCIGLGLNCIWDDGCKYGDLRILTCEQANTKYSCSNVLRQDQYCIWFEDQCINTLTHHLYSNYYSMAPNLIRNKHQCVMQEKSFFRYNVQSKQCIQETVLDTKELTNINRYFCFALKLYTQWDFENQQCLIIEPSNSCDQRNNINPTLCSLFQNCYYDEINFTCQVISKTQTCTTIGQTKQECLSNSNELCQWRFGQCGYLTAADKCFQLVDVTSLACSQITSSKCSYLNGSCTANIVNTVDCQPYMNKLQCQAQSSACYYNQYTCQAPNQYQLSCSGLSLQACIRSKYQACIYLDNQCQVYQMNYFTACDENVNELGCTQRKHDGKLNLAHFCQFDTLTSKCMQKVDQISDCGTNLSINIHRCVAFTQQSCYFSNNICQSVSSDSNYLALQLNQIQCSQANLQICYLITTPGQICTKQVKTGFSICMEAPLYFWNTYTCSQITFDGNPNRCTLATDKCYYTSSGCVLENNPATIYDCDSIISKSLCLTQTRGKCVFVNKRCQWIKDVLTECQYRNQYSCEHQGRNCKWNSECQDSSDFCPITYHADTSICQNGVGLCFGGQNGCQSLPLTNLPCDIGLSEQLCHQQNHLCIWIDEGCTSYIIKDCSQMKTLESCLSIQHLSCVYKDNQCIEDTQTEEYNSYYSNENYEYCMNHKLNVYTTRLQCKQLFSDSLQMDISNSFNMQCSSATTMLQCVQQKSAACTFQGLTCSQSSLNSCSQQEGVYQSPQSCDQIPGCGWKTTKTGEGFCYEGTFSCTAITLQQLCLQDHGLKCQYNNNKCTEANFTTCDAVKGIKVNYLTCRSLAPNCFYDFETSLCKVIQRLAITCNAAKNLYDCAFSANNCLLAYSSGSYQSCTDASPSFNVNLNQLGCTALTGQSLQYDLLTYTCLSIGTTQVRNCRNLNFDACTKNTELLQCIWLNSECQIYSFQTPDCPKLNKLACINQYQNHCIWSDNICQDSVDCSTHTCLYSLGYCQGIGKLWNSLNYQCYSYTPAIILSCDNMGYSKTQCLNQNYLSCYWNDGRCTSSIYKMTIDCSNLSQTVCANFKCKWTTGCVANTGTLTCDQYTRLPCLEISNNNCIWDSTLNQCVTPNHLQLFLQKCDAQLSLQLCKQVINDTCMLYDQICKKWVPRLFGCDYIYNHYGCMYAQMSCQWLNDKCQDINQSDKFVCKDIPSTFNKFSCSQFASDPCSFDDTLQKCTFKVKNTILTADSSFTLKSDTCNDYSTLIDCESSFTVECQWKNNACIASTMDTCDSQNILGCVQNSSLCKWRNKRCYSAQDYYVDDLPTLVSKSVCIVQTVNKNIKYDKSTYSCVLSDPSIDTCTTEGLNDNGCYSILTEECQFTNQCIPFVQVEKDSCNKYKNVNAKVCSGLNLACKYDELTYQCIDAQTTDDCTTKGLSKSACLQITTVPCLWDSYCQPFIPNNMINQCDEVTITNSIACQFIDYQQQICTYDPILNSCTPKINRFSKCSTPGLNKYACFATLLQPCQFVDSCQVYTVTNNTCYSILNVNEVACAYQQNYSCAYQSSSFSCTGVSLTVPCDSRGINQMACALQSSCVWNTDTYYCVYQAASLTNCNTLNKDSCIASKNCFYDSDLSICRIKHCWDFNIGQCNGQLLNDELCYLDYNNNCQTAKKCEDIIYLSPNQNCSNFQINNASCHQINNYCVSPTAYNKICPQTDCSNSYCIQDYGYCRAFVCSDYSYTDCPTQNCAWIDDQCQSINFCSDISDSQTCTTAKVGNEQCTWQPSALKIGPYHCTSKPCYLFGSSWYFCQGNEMGGQACFVTSYAQCESCEQQTDQATCLSNSSCSYINKQCKSVLCQHFVTQEICIANTRCYWSSVDEVCRKQCTKIVEKALCDAIDYECHWNSATYQCESGVQYNPDLSITIPDSSIKGWLLTLTILIIIEL